MSSLQELQRSIRRCGLMFLEHGLSRAVAPLLVRGTLQPAYVHSQQDNGLAEKWFPSPLLILLVGLFKQYPGCAVVGELVQQAALALPLLHIFVFLFVPNGRELLVHNL